MFNTLTRMGASAASDYEIERSLRFNDDDSAYLSRTFGSAGDQRTFTFSWWCKICVSGSHSPLFSGNGSSGFFKFQCRSDGRIEVNTAEGGSDSSQVITTRKFRDPSAWYHIVVAYDTTQGTSSNRVKIYINGTQETAFDTNTLPSQNHQTCVNTAQDHEVGGRSSTSNYFDGYMTDVHFIDGSQLAPSSFGETNALTGQWVAKKYAGSYGSNGFHLKFADNSGTTATTLGKDSSGNGNNFTPNNLSVTSGETDDSLTDTPFENFCTLNTIQPTTTQNGTVSNGALDIAGDDYILQRANWHFGPGGITSGKWMWEIKNTASSGNTQYGPYAGITGNFVEDGGEIALGANKSWASTSSFVYKDYTATSGTEPGAGNQSLGTMTFGLDLDAQTLKYYYNGSLLHTDSTIPDPAVTEFAPFIHSTNSGGADWANSHFNFGQRGFSYGGSSGLTAAGYKALSTANISDPTIKIPKEHFDSLLYVGDTSGNLTVTGLEFEPDLVWIKDRETTDNHQAFDTVRGFTNGRRLFPNENSSEASNGSQYGMISTQNGGFTVGAGPFEANRDGDNHVAWNWKAGGSASSNSNGTITSSVSANTTAGFSIVTWTGTGSAGTIGHGLGVAPKWFVVKLRSGSQDWFANNGMIMSDYGKYFKWNTDGSSASDTNVFPNTAPTSTVFSVGTDNAVNGNTDTYVAYCFSEVVGYSKISSYEGLGGTDGPFVYTGFRPSFVMIKNVDSGSRWWVVKTSKIPGYNLLSNGLAVNVADAEQSLSSIDILSNGFKIRNNGSYTNETNSTHMYMAFAEHPFKYANAR